MSPARGQSVTTEVDGRQLTLSNLDKVLYPSGFTKGEVIDYHFRIAPVMVPHLEGRCLTFKRFPDGTDAQGFFEKRCPKHRPEWVPVALGPGDRRGGVEYCRIEETAALVWAGNLAAIELHAPMASGRRSRHAPRPRLRLRSRTAHRHQRLLRDRDRSARDPRRGRRCRAGARRPAPRACRCTFRSTRAGVTHERAADFALAVGQVLERQLPKRVTTTMAKAVRPGKIFVDWSQNAFHKTTIAPYSLRARPEPTVSTPVGWDEVEASAGGDVELRFEAGDVLERVAEHGDLFEPVLTLEQRLPDARRRDAASGPPLAAGGRRGARGRAACTRRSGRRPVLTRPPPPSTTTTTTRDPRRPPPRTRRSCSPAHRRRRPRRARPRTTPAAAPVAWEEFDEALASRMLGSGDFAVSVAVAVDGELVHTGAFGYRVPPPYRPTRAVAARSRVRRRPHLGDDRAQPATRRRRGDRPLPHRQHLQGPHRHRGAATRRVRRI